MKGRIIPYSADELAWVHAHHTEPRAIAHAAFVAAFNRTDLTLMNFNALCKRKGWMTGRTGTFAKGQAPHNKGQKMPFHPNSAATRFKPGRAPHNTNFLGHERVSKDGYVEISVDVPNKHTGYARSYVLKHHWEWEAANGPVPKGHCLKCQDGNRTNTSPENWIPIRRAILPRLSGRFGRNYDTAPAALKPTILAIATLQQQAADAINKRTET